MKDYNDNDTALKVNKGIEPPPVVNPNLSFLKHKSPKKYNAKQYIDGILARDLTMLSKAITMIESSSPLHADIAQEIIEGCLPYAGNSIRIGITGVPGAGKSTFIEAMGKHITQRGERLAVLAIDPSSSRSKGSILGDKTRMFELSANANAFIRPSPSAGSLGGVARKTRESIILTEAAGYNVIFVETVGVGQSEIAVHSMVDFFLLLMISGAGDELQGIKRGIMEMADTILINKADGDNIKKANLSKAEYKNAIHLFPPSESGWETKVETCSSITKEGIPEVWDIINDYANFSKQNGYFSYRRNEQAKMVMYETIDKYLQTHFYQDENIKTLIKNKENDVLSSKISPYVAAKDLLDKYFQ